MTTKLLISLTLLLTIQQFAQAYNLNGKKWAGDRATILFPEAFNEPLMRKRMRIITKQFQEATGIKFKGRFHDLQFNSLLEVQNFIALNDNLIIILYKPGLTYGLASSKVAKADFTTTNGGTLVTGGLIRINDIRYQEVTAGIESRSNYKLNYLANVTGHEEGHLLGLDHVSLADHPKAIMTLGKFSKLKNLGLAPDDKRGLREIYKGDSL